MYLKDTFFSFQKGKLKFYYLRNLKRKIPSGFNRCLQYLNPCYLLFDFTFDRFYRTSLIAMSIRIANGRLPKNCN